MLTNADCTIFTKLGEIYMPSIIRGVYWSEETRLDEERNGINSAAVLTVRIPLERCGALSVKLGDLIACGCVNAVVKSKTELEQLCGSAYTVVGFKLNNIGSRQIRHWRINGR